MSPRRSVADARDTRSAILVRGVELATVEGLDGLTIGRLAAELGLSKSGVLGHFGAKEALQLAVIDTAAEQFGREVVEPSAGTTPGLPRLRALCEAWLTHLTHPCGSFFISAAAEFDRRPGPVRDAIAGMSALWERDLRMHVRLALTDGDLHGDGDQIVFDLVGTVLAANHALHLTGDAQALPRARRALARKLGQD
ncbi:TetR/AcrR family transcriptional regulator [Amycolatopsis sp. YIM 10]|uniref:TetR/AcrR family transcriptional regulator n=1 Tax=Amycolatopsis sp. YIM 10 TaxID=2653857 RepID=UPI0012904971|nr:TetR/AcrR family transcriptional regulator [Amycolatopsis sp. YIM 10]QFU94369.1 Transcriptional regulator, TetR family [Amycolatopsis sp. YIM 10]